ISADGNWIAFTSLDTNLVANESSSGGLRIPSYGVYLYNVQTGAVTLVNHLTGQPSIHQSDARSPVISSDGHFVAYVLGSLGNVHGSTKLYDRVADTTTDITPAGTSD